MPKLEIGEDILADHVLEHVGHSPSNTNECNHGPLTRSRAKKIQDQVKAFLTGYDFTISKNGILPNCSKLMFPRFTHEMEQATNMENNCNDRATRCRPISAHVRVSITKKS